MLAEWVIGVSMADMRVNVLQDAILSTRRGRVVHGFLTRGGGVSVGEFASLNCGLMSGDEIGAVEENRRRAVAAIGEAWGVDMSGHILVMGRQVHGDRVWPAHMVAGARGVGGVEGDAIVSSEGGYALGILAADCCPVLLLDGDVPVIAAVHAGWRGAFGGVLENTLAAMETHGALRGRIVAALGPMIGWEHYPVGDDFYVSGVERDSGSSEFFVRRVSEASGGEDSWHFDIGGYIRLRLGRAGVGEVSGLNVDTYGDADRFFSARRAGRDGSGGKFGRMISIIAIV